MSNDFLNRLNDEIDSLRRELDSDPRFHKLQKLKEILTLYRIEQKGGSVNTEDTVTESVAVRRSPPVRRPTKVRKKAEELTESLLFGRTSPTPTREIYEFLLSEGVSIGGKQPTSNLSAILSKSDSFVSLGRAGWILTEMESAVNAPSAEATGDDMDAERRDVSSDDPPANAMDIFS